MRRGVVARVGHPLPGATTPPSEEIIVRGWAMIRRTSSSCMAWKTPPKPPFSCSSSARVAPLSMFDSRPRSPQDVAHALALERGVPLTTGDLHVVGAPAPPVHFQVVLDRLAGSAPAAPDPGAAPGAPRSRRRGSIRGTGWSVRWTMPCRGTGRSSRPRRARPPRPRGAGSRCSDPTWGRRPPCGG